MTRFESMIQLKLRRFQRMALDLNYKPNVLVDTATLTEDEWLSW